MSKPQVHSWRPNFVLALAALLLGSQPAAATSATVAADSNQKQEQQTTSSVTQQQDPQTPEPLAGYLMSAHLDRKLNESQPDDAQLLALLHRLGPDMRPLRDFRDFPGVGLGVAQRAWRLMHEHAQQQATTRLQPLRRATRELASAAQVSNECMRSLEATISAAEQLDSWAIQLLNAWGSFPPSGLFEGTFGDIGSYHGCLDVPENEATGHAHYCSVAFRPVVPTRRDYELIITREPRELLDTFDNRNSKRRDAFADLLLNAQYNHYIYYKLGTCFPIGCSPRDVHKLARLVGRRNALLSGPVKCYSKRSEDYKSNGDSQANSTELQISTRDLNEGVYIWRPHVTNAQWVAMSLVGLVSAVILTFTLIDLLGVRLPRLYNKMLEGQKKGIRSEPELELAPTKILHEPEEEDPNNNCTDASQPEAPIEPADTFKTIPLNDETEAERKGGWKTNVEPSEREAPRSTFMELVDDCSLVTNTREFFTVSQSQLNNDILCINGVRCITMSWIIVTHTMQYNDWSAFARTREIETHLRSLLNQPLFNASYLVDSFFLVSGLLTAYSSFKSQAPFSARNYLVGRWLRLTPQILLTSLLFILLPLASKSAGPHWYTITGEYSENCTENWWVNLLHVQAFFRADRMCNFVCWWVSVDMLFHVFALALILVTLRLGPTRAMLAGGLLVVVAVAVQSGRHYLLSLPPNLLSTVPQTGAMWSEMTLDFFWTPYAHALPFAIGLLVGYLLARRPERLANLLRGPRALSGWLVTLSLLVAQSYSTYGWVTGAVGYSRGGATLFYAVCPLIWATCLAWLVVACQLGHGGPINRLLSAQLFVVLGKASYLVYLSHFLVLFSFYGAQNLLLEPTQLVMLYVMLGNILLSMLLGCALCIAFEMPWLKLHKRIMRRLR